jgi:hypothetical protein
MNGRSLGAAEHDHNDGRHKHADDSTDDVFETFSKISIIILYALLYESFILYLLSATADVDE